MDKFDEKHICVNGVWFTKSYFNDELCQKLKTFETRSDDVFIVSYPKCGECIKMDRIITSTCRDMQVFACMWDLRKLSFQATTGQWR